MKKAFKKLLSVVFCLLIACVLFTGCKFEDQGEVGTYCAYEDSKTTTLNLNERKFTLEDGTTNYDGKYTFDGETNELTFKFSDKTEVEVDYQTNVLTFQYQGTQYTLYRNVKYAVTYDTNGGSTIQTADVINGKAATEPKTNPTKDGYRFIGWYADASYKQLYDFDQIITAETTVYARFEKATDANTEYDVTYVTGIAGVTFDDELTLNGAIYILPTIEAADKKFLGWWVSDYEDATKLTYQYKEMMVLKQDTTLYAVYEDTNVPTISIADGKISWDSKGVNKQYAVNIVDADDLTTDEVYTKRVSTTSVDFDFTTVPFGNYLVSVTCGDYTGKAYYCNYGLARVSNFQVVDNKLTWNKVENATNYIVTIECGLSGHQHTDLDLGDVNEYDLSNCIMPKDGVKVTIKAAAENYVTSASKEYVYFNELDDVKNIKVDGEKQVATWDAVNGATSYKVTILADEKENTYTVEGTEIDLSAFTGNLKISVAPQAACMYAEATAYDYAKTTLQVPANIKLLGFNVTWDEVAGAKSYTVKIGDKEYTTNTNVLVLTQEDCQAIDEFRISIQAIAEDAANNSLFSKETVVNKEGVNEITYKNGVISWNAVPGTLKYAVKVDDGEVQIVENASEVEYAITSGKHNISVTVADANNNYGDFYTNEVTVYALTLNTCGGDELEPIYLCKGDNIGTLPEATFKGYSFIGWYNIENGAQNSEQPFADVTYEYDEDKVIYASWQGNTYKVTFDYGTYGIETSKEQEVIYGSKFTLPVPESNSSLKVFVGWYSEQNGQGEQYTDAYGASIRNWRDYQTINLFAAYADVFKFTKINNDTEYAVGKGDGITYVTEIKIPATYEDLPVTTINADGFKSCSNLKKILLPNSIQNVETGKDGPTGAGCCFQSCTKLEAIEMYEVDGVKPEDVKYQAIDGVLIYSNSITGAVEIAYVPYYTKGGTYTVPSIVTTIPQNAFKSCSKIEEIIIPHTVKTISDSAFASCTKLARVTFLDAPDGTAEQELVLGKSVFTSNSALIEITLPNRIAEFNYEIFTSCTKLEKVNFSGTYEGAKYKSVDGVVLTADGTKIIFCPRGKVGEYVVPTGVNTIGESAFDSCKSLTAITIPGEVAKIETKAFYYCSAVTSLVFQGKTGDVDLSIGELAFYYCTGLTELSLPENLKTLDLCSFGGCSKLTKVNVYSTNANIKSTFKTGAFGTNSTAPTFYVVDLFLSKDVHEFDVSGVFGAIKLTTVTVEEGNQYFKSIDGILYNSDITSLLYYPTEKEGSYTLPTTITSIGDRVFQGKTGIDKITIGKNVTSIGEYAFQSCTKLTEVIFEAGGENNLTIGEGAFMTCSVLANITLPSRVTAIPKNCFKNCYKITTMIIPEGVTSIGSEAFYNCSGMTSISIPASCTELVAAEGTLSTDKEVRVRVFDSCTSLEEYIVAAGNTKYQAIDGILYENVLDKQGQVESIKLLVSPCAKVGVVTLPTNVSVIQTKAFYYNKSITEIKFAGALTCELTIGNYAFYYCEKLAKIELPTGVKSLDKYVFYYCKALEEITIPNTLETIGNYAFYYSTALKKVNFAEGGSAPLTLADATTYTAGCFYSCPIEELIFPERTTYIGKYSCSYLNSLKKVVLPESLETLGDYAFYYDKALTSVTFANNKTKLTTIPTYAFYHCDGLTKVEIPEGIEKINNYAFNYCINLEEVKLPTTLINLGGSTSSTYYYSVFSGCTKLSKINLEECTSLEVIGSNCFQNTLITSITIPQSVKSIGSYAFSKCKNLTNITFAGSDTEEGCALRSIGTYAFEYTAITKFEFPYCGIDDKGDYNHITVGTTSSTTTTKKLFRGCSDLVEVYLSQAIVNIDDMFTGCTNVTKITVASGNKNFKIDETKPLVLNFEGTAIKFAFGELKGTLEIPEGCTEISDYAFKNQASLTKVVIPSTVKSIGQYAFTNCINLETVEFGNGSLCDDIGTYAFMNCVKLKEIKLPEALVKVPNYLFVACTGLEKVTLSTKTESIGTYAFSNCWSLKEIDLPETLTTISNYAFYNCKSLKEVTIPASLSVSSAGVTTGWGTYSFEYCSGLEKVIVSEGITLIPNYAFAYCTSLKEITLPSTITAIGNNAFAQAAFKTFTVPSSVVQLSAATSTASTSAGGYVFQNCTNLEQVIFADGSACTCIGTYCFDGCTNLKSINLPDTIKYINAGAFRGCTELEITTLPASLTNLGATGSSDTTGGVFENCTKLTAITIPATVTVIGANCFKGSGITEITIPAKVTTISYKAFYGTPLTKVIFDKAAVTTWGSYAFAECTALKEVSLGDYLAKLGTSVFEGCTALEEIELPTKMTMLNSTATTTTTLRYFANCTSLKKVTFKATSFTSIGSYVFAGCTALETITLPNTLQYIMYGTFMDCTSLKEITIPAKVSKIGYSYSSITYNGAFEGCTSLAKVTWNATTASSSIGSFAFKDCTSLTSFTIPAKVTSIGINAFTNTAITSISVPSTVSYIYNPFAGMDKLTSFEVLGTTYEALDCGLIIKKSTKTIVGVCPNAPSEITVPETVTAIQGYSFYGVTLDKITLSNAMATVAAYSFKNCNIDTVDFGTALKSLTTYVFADSHVNTFEHTENLTVINTNCFYNCKGFTKFELSTNSKLTSLGLGAFAYTDLEEITIPENIVMFGSALSSSTSVGTFCNCANLTKVNLHEKLATISNGTFQGTGITEIVVPASVTVLAGNVFKDCTNLVKATINYTGNMTASSTCSYLFSGCTALKEVVLAEGITTTSTYMFTGCTALETITLPSTVKEIQTGTFAESGLKEITLPTACTNVWSKAFQNCVNLKKVTLNDGLQTLGTVPSGSSSTSTCSVFEGCTALEEINIPETLTSIGDCCFANCTALKSIYLPNSLEYVGYQAFLGWTKDQCINIQFSEYETVGNYYRSEAATVCKVWYDDINAVITYSYVEPTK